MAALFADMRLLSLKLNTSVAGSRSVLAASLVSASVAAVNSWPTRSTYASVRPNSPSPISWAMMATSRSMSARRAWMFFFFLLIVLV